MNKGKFRIAKVKVPHVDAIPVLVLRAVDQLKKGACKTKCHSSIFGN